MLGSAVQVRPLLPSTKKAAYRAAFFVRPSSGIRSCGSGPSPRKGGFEPPGRIPEASFSSVRCSVSETRCNGGAFRDRSSHPWPLLVWPSLAKQLPPGTTIAPLTWQRNRHGSERPPGPFYKSSFAEWFSASDAPEHRNLTPERVCVRPFRDPGEQDVRQGAYRDVFTAFPEGPNTDTRPRMERTSGRLLIAVEEGRDLPVGGGAGVGRQ